MTEEVTVYTKEACVQCRLTTALLDQLGIRYGTTNIYDHLEHIQNLGYSSAPVVETATETWAGFQPDLIKRLVSERIEEIEQ